MNSNSYATQSALNRAYWQDRLAPCQVGINQILWDQQCSLVPQGSHSGLPYLWRFYRPNDPTPDGLPAPVRYGVYRADGNRNKIKGFVELSPYWQYWFRRNNTAAALKYIKRPDSGWVNKQPWPKVAQVGWCGSYVVVTKIDGNKAFIMSYDNSKRPRDYRGIDYLQQLTVGYSNDNTGLPDCGKCLTFAIRNPGEELYLDVRNLAFLRAL